MGPKTDPWYDGYRALFEVKGCWTAIVVRTKGWTPFRRDRDCLPTIRGPGVYPHHLLEGVMDATRTTWRGGQHLSILRKGLWKIRALPSNVVVLQFPIVLGSTGNPKLGINTR